MLELSDRSVFYHSCGGWAGLSGAPIVIDLNDEPMVIGMDIAKIMRPLDMQGPLFLGVGLAINEMITAAIQQAADHARSSRGR